MRTALQYVETLLSSRRHTDTPQIAPTKRYVEHPKLGVSSGLAPDFAMGLEDSQTQRDVEGDLTVEGDLAEMTLGERLGVVNDDDVSSDNEEEGAAKKSTSSKSKKSKESNAQTIPASSLTRTLIQALHSSDNRLLEMCLAHSDPELIRNTVRKLPPQLAIPLVNACVERLGRGARGAAAKGRGGGASSQRGMGLVSWIREVLGVHMGHLMTVRSFIFAVYSG